MSRHGSAPAPDRLGGERGPNNNKNHEMNTAPTDSPSLAAGERFAQTSDSGGHRWLCAADIYVEREWTDLLPIPHRQKSPVPPDVTGRNGRAVTDEDLERWFVDSPDHPAEYGRLSNLALRMPDGVVGIDIDCWNGKPGAATLAAWEAKYGPLPVAPASSSRDDGSRIVFFRVPPGLEFMQALATDDHDGSCSGVEIIQRSHRYAMVWPSVHPEGREYRWDGDGEIPRVTDLPELPSAWVQALIRKPPVREYTGPSYDGPGYADLPQAQRQLIDANNRRTIERWRAKLAEAADWSEGDTDDQGRGWEVLCYQAAWVISGLVTPWSGISAAEARDIYYECLGDLAGGGVNYDPEAKWNNKMKMRANEPVPPPPTVPVKPEAAILPDEGLTLQWLKHEIGRNQLSGIFRRGVSLVYTPRVGEDGYIPPDNPEDDDGPAQVRQLGPGQLAAWVDHYYEVTRYYKKAHPAKVMFPEDIAKRSTMIPDLLQNVRPYQSVTHTPVVRADGTILNTPGYDSMSQMLYLPEPSLIVPPVPDRPTADDVARARSLLLDDLLVDFPWVSEHDLANYLGALLTPLLRPLAGPPYKLIGLNAHQPGSGKSLLALILRIIHGGVFRTEFPSSEEERGKVITAILYETVAPVIQFDNVTGLLKSGKLDGLLTSAVYSERILGATRNTPTLPNDRLWIITGNNLRIGGDLRRRVLWATIDPGRPEPEKRTGFKHDLYSWTPANRGAILWALLVLIRAWVIAGRPAEAAPTTDDYGVWVATVRGILAYTMDGRAGVFGHKAAAREESNDDDEELRVFLEAAHDYFGSDKWTTKKLFEQVGKKQPISWDEIPGDIDPFDSRKAQRLGQWLQKKEGRWVGGNPNYVVRSQPGAKKRDAKLWSVEEKHL